MAIKVATVAFLKTTEEPVFVLALGKKEDVNEGLSGDVATVRRPVVGEQGVSHKIEVFYTEELESLEDKRKRNIAEFSSMKAQIDREEFEVPKANLKN